MAYSNTRLHLTFDNLPITDPVGSTIAVTGSPSLSNGIHGSSLEMKGIKASCPAFSFTNKLSFGFWLQPVNPGLASNGQPLNMAVIAQGPVTYSSGQFIANSPTFIVYEQTQNDGTNKLVILLSGQTGLFVPVSIKITSSAYTTGVFHHFFLNYDGASGTAKLYIDLAEDLATVRTGTVPTTLNSSTTFTLNKITEGYTYQSVENEGAIDDLVIFNKVITLSEIQRVANMGALFVADTSYSNVEEIYQGFIVDDPSTVQITSVFANRGNIYVGRTDGKLLRGVRSLWESRHEFSDNRELNTVTVISKTDDNNLSVNDGILKLQNEVIRI
jgi:hypothetical protein